MGVLARLTKEPSRPETSRIPWVPKTTAGVYVNEDNAMMNGAVWGCLTYISESIGGLPWRVLREVPNGNELAPAHPVDKILYVRPNAETSAFQLKETLVHHALRFGNSYCEIERDQMGRPFALHILHPERVEVCRNPATGELYYEVNNGTGGTAYLDQMDCFHLRGFGDGPVGLNVIHYAAQSIGWARASQLFGASFFGNGMNIGGVVTNKVALSKEALAYQRAEFDTLYSGPRNAHKTAHLDADASYTPLGAKMSDSQFVEIQRHLVEEICRFFRVPPHIVAELSRSTNNNIEHQSIEAVQRCLTPWCVRLEQEADYKLFGQNRRGFFTKIKMAALLRGDQKAQAEAFRVYREIGVYGIDEIREKLDENKVGGDIGEMRTMNGTYMSLENIRDNKPNTATATASTPAEPNDEPDDEDDMDARARFKMEAGIG